MLLLYALPFFLFSISAAVPTGFRDQLAQLPSIELPAPNAADGYWVLKQPPQTQYATSRVLKIEDKELSTFELDKDFKIVQGSIRPVPSYAEKYLAGVWHEVPRRDSPEDHRFRELTISGKITLELPDTKASKLEELEPDPSGSHSLSTTSESMLHEFNGYWVLGDSTKDVPVETWRKILHLEDGKYSTFELDDKFNIIEESRKNVDNPSPGDYFQIPFKETYYSRRFAVLRVRKNGIRRIQYLDTNES